MKTNRDELTELDFDDPMEWVYEVRRRISEKYDHDIRKLMAATAERMREEEAKGRRYVKLPIARRETAAVK